MNQERPLILLAEDDDAHAKIFAMAVEESGVDCDFIRMPDGEQALQYLRREAPHAQAQMPDLLLLDLKLPRVDGMEVLRTIRGDANLYWLPVVIMTTSSSGQDRQDTRRAGANSYLIKPVEFERFLEMVADTIRYWTRWHMSDRP